MMSRASLNPTQDQAMPRDALLAAAACLLLSGCVLQSKDPLYGDDSADLALGSAGGTTESASRKDGAWVIDGDPMPIVVQGRHYVVHDKTDMTLLFARLEGDWYVLQAREGNGPAAYMLAEVRNQVAEVHPLLCRDLALDQEAAAQIEFKGEDCAIKTGASPKRLFTALVNKSGDATGRLRIVH
jgi:hypothetical protein